MEIIKYPSETVWPAIARRPAIEAQALEAAVSESVEQVKAQGDEALRALTARFDGIELGALDVAQEEVCRGAAACPDDLQAAIRLAAGNIERFHAAQRERTIAVETSPGVLCWRKSVPIDRVGLYVPGGSAPLFSTVLMLAVPARLAGCTEIVMCTPPGKDGVLHPAMLYAAVTAGVTRIFRIGGAQAIAAMAFGTASVPAVDKLFGPGNQYVTCAKRLIAARTNVAVDMPAGPSELLVIADRHCNPAFVAADLLSQAEHGPDSQVVLATDTEEVLTAVADEVERQLARLPRRALAEQALGHSKALLFTSIAQALDFSNTYAPEHLILAVEDPERWAEKVRAAGSVFLGNHTTESFGDYTAGVNHTLPTGGAARAYSGVSLDSFVKKITFHSVSAAGLRELVPPTVLLATAEGLEAHANAARLRAAQDDLPAPQKPRIEALLRSNIRTLTPYSCARHEHASGRILLDANENALGSAGGAELNRYPDPLQLAVKERIGNLKGVSPANILIGNGSDEAIDLLIRAFCEPDSDKILIMPPTYGMYSVSAEINGVALEEVPLTADFQIDLPAAIGKVRLPVKLTFVCSPNNPTANLLGAADIMRLAAAAPGIVAVDEAYIDFAAAHTLLPRLGELPNLVIMQTLSKAWGLAGARVGILFASTEVIDTLNRVKPPYNVSAPAQQAALAALAAPERKDEMVAALIEQRARVVRGLRELPFVHHIFPSDANFLLVKVPEPGALLRFLEHQGIIVRNRSNLPGCEGCLRITIGSPDENAQLLEACRSFGRMQ